MLTDFYLLGRWELMLGGGEGSTVVSNVNLLSYNLGLPEKGTSVEELPTSGWLWACGGGIVLIVN